jgi:hypothetical protein
MSQSGAVTLFVYSNSLENRTTSDNVYRAKKTVFHLYNFCPKKFVITINI